jgi:hypothetical protein
MRGSPFVIQSDDLSVFTAGLVPDDERAMRHFLAGMAPVLEKAGVSAVELVEHLADGLREALDGRTLTKRQMGLALAPKVPSALRKLVQR